MLSSNNLVEWLILLLIIHRTSGLSFNQPKFCPIVSWQTNGTTIANSTMTGLRPIGMFIDINNTIYINDRDKNRVQLLFDGNTIPMEINSLGLNHSNGIFVTNNGDIYLDNGEHNGRVNKWSNNSANMETVMYVETSCFGLFVDTNNSLYCSLQHGHRVVKRSLVDDINTTKTIAGNGTCGNTLDMLNLPTGIFVHTNFSLYVADYSNHRIQLFQPGQSHGITLVGSAISESLKLKNPTSITMDANNYLFITDRQYSSILRFGPDGLHCIIGCSGINGPEPNQLNLPSSISFDTHGNIFVLDELNHRIQKFLLARNSCVPYNQPKICPNATWSPNAVTLANISRIGECPRGIFVDLNNTLFVAASQRNQILVWSEGNIDPIQILNVTVCNYTSPFVTINGDIYFETNNEKSRIFKCSNNSSIIVREFDVSCYGLFIDTTNTLYCSAHSANKIVSSSLSDSNNSFIDVVGTGSAGSSSTQFSYPYGIFVDTNFDLYVADTGNNRIQHFRQGEKNGTTVAGNRIPQGLELKGPTNVILDADGYLFVADNDNHRIIRVGFDVFECIVGCNNGHSGTALNELNKPYAIRFDSYGNLYVADEYNHRIQKFTLMTNSCETFTTVTSTTEPATTSSAISQKQSEVTTTEQSSTISTVTSHLITTTIAQTTSALNVQQLSDSFYPKTCRNSTFIGSTCNVSNMPCERQKPCQHKGNCSNNITAPHGYICSCLPGFNGSQCEFDHRRCKSNICQNKGQCNETLNATSLCICTPGWEGIYCEKKINFCLNITCMNRGICQPLFLNYTCQCLDGYSGHYCEITATKIIIYKIISKSFAYIAILAMITVAIFVVVMDILKYCFDIDPVREERERIRRKRLEKTRRSIIQ